MAYGVITKEVDSIDSIIYYQIDCIKQHLDLPILPLRVAFQNQKACLEIDISNKICLNDYLLSNSLSRNQWINLLLFLGETLRQSMEYFLDPYCFKISLSICFYPSNPQNMHPKNVISTPKNVMNPANVLFIYLPLVGTCHEDPIRTFSNEVLHFLSTQSICVDKESIQIEKTNGNEVSMINECVCGNQETGIFSQDEQERISLWSIENLDEVLSDLRNMLEFEIPTIKAIEPKGKWTLFTNSKRALKSNYSVNSNEASDNSNIKCDEYNSKSSLNVKSESSGDKMQNDPVYINNVNSTSNSNDKSGVHKSNSTNKINSMNNKNTTNAEARNKRNGIGFGNSEETQIPPVFGFHYLVGAISTEVALIVLAFFILRNQDSFTNRVTPILLVSTILLCCGILDLYLMYSKRSPLNIGLKKENPLQSSPYSKSDSIFNSKEEKTVLLESSQQRTRIAMLCSGVPGTNEESTGLKAYILVDDFVIGRDGMKVDFKINCLSIGRIHARITRRENSFFVEDLDSRNGTFVNQKKLKKNEEYPLPENCKVRFADKEFNFVAN